jgi:hypothetical protein
MAELKSLKKRLLWIKSQNLVTKDRDCSVFKHFGDFFLARRSRRGMIGT